MSYSTIIKNGTIIDGTGNPGFLGDIGIKKDIISTIGNLSKENADFVFDASGLFVSPGFIDLTSHSDTYGTIFNSPLQESMLSQGVSTILLGNCGESLAPIVKKESVPINADWNSMKEYLDSLESSGVGVNCATLVGQETLFKNSDNSADRLFYLEKSLKEGAWGMSSNLSFHDLNESFLDETGLFLKKIKKFNGIYKVHLRDEGINFLPSVVSIVNLARQTAARTIISHFKAVGRSAWPDFPKAINIIEKARNDGVDISFDVFPYLRTGSQLVLLLPAWAREGNNEDILKRLNKKTDTEHIINDLKNATLHPENILIAFAKEGKNMVGKNLKQISADFEKSAEETLVEILKVNNLFVTIFGRAINYQNLLNAISKDYSAISSNGGGFNLDFKSSGNLAHPRSFGTFPRFISKLAEMANLTVEQAVKKITGTPASMLSLKNRGVLKKGYIADISVFNKNNFKDKATYSDPYKYSSGVELVLISGNTAFLKEKFVGKFGKILRKT